LAIIVMSVPAISELMISARAAPEVWVPMLTEAMGLVSWRVPPVMR
jgi:hypothetical protein